MIYVTGDVHYPIDATKLQLLNKYLTEHDTLIVCGDMGLVWYNTEVSNRNIRSVTNTINYTLLFCDGNHEHHQLLNNVDITIAYNGPTHKLSDKVYHLMRGRSYTIEDSQFLVIGGAASTDKWRRVPYVDWFPEEEISMAEIEQCLQQIERQSAYDYIITHAAPEEIERKLSYYLYQPSATSKFLSAVKSQVYYKHWYCGHHHTNKNFDDDKLTIIYNYVRNIYTGDIILKLEGRIHDT